MLFLPDPTEEINAKLDAVLEKIDQVLANQQKMMLQLDEINNRLITIAKTLEQQEIVNVFNNRNATYYNPLEVQNTKFFTSAYNLYTKNKGNLSQEDKDKLGEYAKEWVGAGETYADLTWNYIKYLSTVQHTKYGTGMDKIYDGLTFDKYPWEHLGIGDRKSYRAYDMAQIVKSLFMINLYAAYGGLTDTQKEGLYNIYDSYKKSLKTFCEFKIANPDEFLVCQIPGAHFVMHKELQKYNYLGANNKAPHPEFYGRDAVYRLEWHEAGDIKIENPAELKSKLISIKEVRVIYNYYKTAFYPNQKDIAWGDMLVDGKKDGQDISGGAVYAEKPTTSNSNARRLMLYDTEDKNGNGVSIVDGGKSLGISPTVGDKWDIVSTFDFIRSWFIMGEINQLIKIDKWMKYDTGVDYYAAIIAERY